MKKILILLLGLMVALAGCNNLPGDYTPIGEIVRNPGRFEGEPVTVRGEVVGVTSIPLIKVKCYTLSDKTGKILVMTEGNLPSLEETVAIKAQVKTAAILDGQNFGLRLVEIE